MVMGVGISPGISLDVPGWVWNLPWPNIKEIRPRMGGSRKDKNMENPETGSKFQVRRLIVVKPRSHEDSVSEMLCGVRLDDVRNELLIVYETVRRIKLIISAYRYVWVTFSLPDRPVWRVLGPSRQYGWLIVSANQYVWVSFHVLMGPVWTVLGRIRLITSAYRYVWVTFSLPDRPVWTVLGPCRQYGWLIVSANQYVWVSFHYVWIDFSWPDAPVWTVLGPSKKYGLLIV
ncbi:hypothetical protein N665_1108s0001 [Sinapis alba]|nr:hypothetical protein N665_1108s0001 [Sinapis alba]